MLTLNNCVNDPSKAQQSLVYGFMNKAGVPAPRSNLARVSVNGEDLGVYANVESVRKPLIKRWFGDCNGELYEAQNGGDLTTNRFSLLEDKCKRAAGSDRRKWFCYGHLPISLSITGVLALRFWFHEMLPRRRRFRRSNRKKVAQLAPLARLPKNGDCTLRPVGG